METCSSPRHRRDIFVKDIEVLAKIICKRKPTKTEKRTLLIFLMTILNLHVHCTSKNNEPLDCDKFKKDNLITHYKKYSQTSFYKIINETLSWFDLFLKSDLKFWYIKFVFCKKKNLVHHSALDYLVQSVRLSATTCTLGIQCKLRGLWFESRCHSINRIKFKTSGKNHIYIYI